ncbi:glycosyltransferase [Sphingobium sp.]|uniref:glycosyltransferase n=1 Tax=Sphingobium sp. TaxID=1912891 RepID=UPI003B3B3D55
MSERPTVAVYLPDLSGGGAERLHVLLNVALEERGFDMKFLLDRRAGALINQVPEDKIVALDASRQLKAFSKLVRYLRTARPDYLISNMEHMNISAVVAARIAGGSTRVIATQHNAFSRQIDRPSIKYRLLPWMYKGVLPFAHKIVAVSGGVGRELVDMLKWRADRVDVIYNGVVAGGQQSIDQDPPHPWLGEERPVIIAMGRMVAQKDFTTLLRAFARMGGGDVARLIILGDGPERNALEAEARKLGIAHAVDMPGFVEHPAGWLSRSALFVLSSQFEGFGNVLVEALSCGTPIVSTNCPFGPSEILDDGRFGTLVDVGDIEAMAMAMGRMLAQDHDRAQLRSRSEAFSIARCADAYAAIMRPVGDAQHG